MSVRSRLADEKRKKYVGKYKMVHHSEFDYTELKDIMYISKAGRGTHETYSDCYIMADTETSKSDKRQDNHVCAWTISIRAYGLNIVTLYGHRPSTLTMSLFYIHSIIGADRTLVYFHNLGYDWVFIRKFMYEQWGNPEMQLNTKPYYPLFIRFENGIELRDSLIIAQRSLERWADDLNVEHKKAVGKWNYDILRNQDYKFNADELEYIENDTLAGVECLDALCKSLKKHVYSMPFTATGIPRDEMRKRARKTNAHDVFLSSAFSKEEQQRAERWVYHGGFTHCNRHILNFIQKGEAGRPIEAYDFCSSYPFVMCAFADFPKGKFMPIDNCSAGDILRRYKDNAFIFTLKAFNIQIKDDNVCMPVLQYSKCIRTQGAIQDNGRILSAEYVEIMLTEVDLSVIVEQYDCQYSICTDVLCSKKGYLPRWFTDYVFECFKNKTMLKGGDAVLYALAKSVVNALYSYGMLCQKPVKDVISEDYDTGEFKLTIGDYAEEYEKYIKRYNSVMNYQYGIWVTSLAMKNLFELGKCVDYENGGIWLYSDTDSAYATKWNKERLEKYNQSCRDRLTANGYGSIQHNGRDYWLGVAELDGQYLEFICVGAKRYAVRKLDGSLKITVAGVPKKGVECLKGDLNNFRNGFIFSGDVTGKKTHTHIIVPEIYMDEYGNECGDSIDLTKCDYELSNVIKYDWEDIRLKEVQVQIFE